MSGTIIRILLVVAVFAIVLSATYPLQERSRKESNMHNYDLMLAQDSATTGQKYLEALKHPENVDNLLNTGTAHAQVLTSQQNFSGAAGIYQSQLAATWGLKTNEYNEKWADANRRLAGAYRDLDSQAAALICYKSVLDHDQQFLPANDLRTARDLNNVGLMHYLIGMGKIEVKDRVSEFKLAKDYFLQSMAIIEKNNMQNSSRAAATLSNLFLACRDLGEEGEAKSYQKRAEAIDKSFKRISREP